MKTAVLSVLFVTGCIVTAQIGIAAMLLYFMVILIFILARRRIMEEYEPTVDIDKNAFGYQIPVGLVVEIANRDGERKNIEAVVDDCTQEHCSVCFFRNGHGCKEYACSAMIRKDEQEVYFMEVE